LKKEREEEEPEQAKGNVEYTLENDVWLAEIWHVLNKKKYCIEKNNSEDAKGHGKMDLTIKPLQPPSDSPDQEGNNPEK
jgi:hypothetical protein